MSQNEEVGKLEESAKSTVDFFKSQLQKTKTGRASTGILEGVQVDYYGTSTPLMQLGLIAVAEPRLITVQVYDAGAIESVEKAIMQANLGLNPARDGNTIRVPIPALTEERRKEIVKRLGKQGEEMKVTVRNHRRAAIDELTKQKKDGDISEDDLGSLKKVIQTVTDKYVAQIDELLKEKEKEILEV